MNRLFVVVVMVVICGSAGCVSTADPIVGEWTQMKTEYDLLYPPETPYHIEMSFYENGSGISRFITEPTGDLLMDSEFTWRVDGDGYVITVPALGDTPAILSNGVLETWAGDYTRLA